MKHSKEENKLEVDASKVASKLLNDNHVDEDYVINSTRIDKLKKPIHKIKSEYHSKKLKHGAKKVHTVVLVLVIAFVGAFGFGVYQSKSLGNTDINTSAAAAMPIIETNYTIPAPDSGKTTRYVGPSETYKTIASAVTAASAGDVIVVKKKDGNGTPYREGGINTSKKLTIVGNPGDQVWLDGTDVVTSWTKASGTSNYQTSWSTPDFCSTIASPNKYYEATGSELGSTALNGAKKKDTLPCAHEDMSLDPSNPMAWDPQAVYLNGTNLGQVDSVSKVTASTFYYDRSAKKIIVGFNPATAGTVEITKRPSAMVFFKEAVGAKIMGIGFRKYATSEYPSSNFNGVIYATPANMKLEKVVLWHNSGTGVAVLGSASNVVVSKSKFVENGFNGLVANQSPNITFENNIVKGNNREKYGTNCNASCASAGVKMAHIAGASIRNNVFDSNKGHGYWCDLDCVDVKFVGNYSISNEKSGMFYEVSSRGIIASNVLANNGNQGIRMCASNTKVYNNTIVDNKGTGFGLYEDPRIAGEPANPDIPDYTKYDTTGNELANNIFSRNADDAVNIIAQKLTKKTINGSTAGKNGTYVQQSVGVPKNYFNAGKFDYNVYQRTSSSTPARLITFGKSTGATAAKPSYTKKDSNGNTLTYVRYEQPVENTAFNSLAAFKASFNTFETNATQSDSVVNDSLFSNYVSPGSTQNDYRITTNSPLAYNNGMPLPADVANSIDGVGSGSALVGVKHRGALKWVSQSLQTITSPATLTTQPPTSNNNAPTTPSNFSASEVTSNSVKLTWGASTDPEKDSFTYTISQGDTVVVNNISATTLVYFVSGLRPATNYTLTIKATDSKGGSSALATTVLTTTTVTSNQEIKSINPSNDAYVDSARPTMAFGVTKPNVLETDKYPSQMDALLRFDVPTISGKKITKAILKLKVVDDGSKYSSGTVYGIPNEVKGSTTVRWYGDSVNWNTAPNIVGSPIFTQGPTVKNQIAEFDLTSYYNVPGLKSIRIVGSDAAGVDYSSSEGVYKPTLELTYQ